MLRIPSFVPGLYCLQDSLMTRPVGVTLTAAFQILGSLFFLLLSIFMLVMPGIMRRAPAPPPTPMPSGILAAAATAYGVLGIAGILTAVGLFRLKNWSRYSTIVFATGLVVVGIIGALILVVMPLPTGNPGSTASNALRVMTSIWLAVAALGGVWLYYFNRRVVREAFARVDEGGLQAKPGLLIGGRRVPVSITVIAGFNLFGAIITIPLAVWFPAVLVIGQFITGKSAATYMILFGLAQIFIGVGLLKLWKSGRTAGILLNCYGLINAATLMLMSNQRLSEIELKIQQLLPTQWPTMPKMADASVSVLRCGTVAGMSLSLVSLYFLVTRRSAFQPQAVELASSDG